MDIVIISNGLGNQMSQYAFYHEKVASSKSVSYITLCKKHNGFELGKIFWFQNLGGFLRAQLGRHIFLGASIFELADLENDTIFFLGFSSSLLGLSDFSGFFFLP